MNKEPREELKNRVSRHQAARISHYSNGTTGIAFRAWDLSGGDAITALDIAVSVIAYSLSDDEKRTLIGGLSHPAH